MKIPVIIATLLLCSFCPSAKAQESVFAKDTIRFGSTVAATETSQMTTKSGIHTSNPRWEIYPQSHKGSYWLRYPSDSEICELRVMEREGGFSWKRTNKGDDVFSLNPKDTVFSAPFFMLWAPERNDYSTSYLKDSVFSSGEQAVAVHVFKINQASAIDSSEAYLYIDKLSKLPLYFIAYISVLGNPERVWSIWAILR